jgi:hypothetical protein
MGGRVVECGGLENRFTGNRNGGSNPSPSALNLPGFGQESLVTATGQVHCAPRPCGGAGRRPLASIRGDAVHERTSGEHSYNANLMSTVAVWPASTFAGDAPWRLASGFLQRTV